MNLDAIEIPPFPFLNWVLFAVCGLLYLVLLFFPPKKINALYGYRTPRSMKNQSTWDFAQKYANQQLLISCIFFFMGALAGCFIPVSSSAGVFLGLFYMLLVFGWVVYKTETALKTKFPETTNK